LNEQFEFHIEKIITIINKSTKIASVIGGLLSLVIITLLIIDKIHMIYVSVFFLFVLITLVIVVSNIKAKKTYKWMMQHYQDDYKLVVMTLEEYLEEAKQSLKNLLLKTKATHFLNAYEALINPQIGQEPQ
jgi:hypothetical protein